MVPVGHGHDDFFVVAVLEGRVWVVHDQRPAQTIGVLAVDVGVVPVSAGLVDLVFVCEYVAPWYGRRCAGTHLEVVGKPLAREDGTLRDMHRPVHMGGTLHEQAVKMQRGGLVAERVEDIDYQLVALVDVDGRNRPLAVDADDRAVGRTVRVGREPAYLEVVGHRGGPGQEGVPGETCQPD